jgi:hypothetical protein
VILHESPEIGDGGDVGIKGMVQQRCPKAAKTVVVIFRHI